MHTRCFGPSKLGALSLGDPAACCVFLLFAPLALCCGKALCAQQSSSSIAPAAKVASSPKPASTAASAAPPASADRTGEDTLDTTPPEELNEDGNPADKQTAPMIITAPRLPASGTAPAAPAIEAPVPANAGGDARRQQINNQCANLLMLANMLQAEVDKTTKDELSVSVVRKAGEIEQLARKVRNEMRPVLSTQNTGARP